MLIDWFTVGAQALNFIILVWLMKRFLYKPIRNAIDAREQRIAAKLADADAKDTGAREQRGEFQRKNEEFDQQREKLLAHARDEAEAERRRLLDEARRAADALSAKRQEGLRRESQNLHQELERLTQREVFAITRKALKDLATTDLEERLVEVFTRRLGELDDEAKASLGAALAASSELVLVRSAFDLPAEHRATLQNALNETFSAEVHLRFETAPDIISGIEVVANGHKLAWSLADYLASLQRGVDESLQQAAKADAKPNGAVESGSTPDAQSEPQTKIEVATVRTPGSEVEPVPGAEES